MEHIFSSIIKDSFKNVSNDFTDLLQILLAIQGYW